MWPAIHSDRRNIPCRIKSTGPDTPRKLLPDVSLESFERRPIQIGPSGTMLAARRQSGRARIALHGDHDRLVRAFCAMVIADTHTTIEAQRDEVTSWRSDAVCLKPDEALPVA